MPHFSPAFLSFFKELAKNNTTEWFNANRKTYEKEVKKPFADFVMDMIIRIQKHEPEIQIKPADAIMRINKDIRFSKDKTPYNTHVAAILSKTGKKDKSYPGLYFQLSPEGLAIYGGAYMIENDKLEKIREHIATHLKEFKSLYSDAAFKEKFGAIQGEQHKRIPQAFQEAHAKEPLIANKQFYFSAFLKPEIIVSEKLPEKIMEYYIVGKKINDFLKQAW
ncbi:MAG TPA: TIGR02453 family protein [Bacteroidetes bacterium]|nr:TIGR02453 family protein [Bacteroidota bacterium]